ncbi:PEP-CTERM sorting domain-containing protein [Massilia antarctica]|uniref:PEP-CTERM sorting domain-containing protein n=2 Tax=Massilia antarctica TaxID=2765360 RepID=A0AA48WJZ2_9BURK|nr:PEP-CTERM sorting domain-containing protein [Massilia antarctica]
MIRIPMFKKPLLALALMSGALSASAATQTYDWSYKGFTYNEEGSGRIGVFDPAIEVDGRFVVDDKNADGKFSVDEVLSFVHAGRDFTKGYDSVQQFSFTPGGTLNFTAGAAWHDDIYSYGLVIVTGEYIGYGFHDPVGGRHGSATWLWSDQTKLTVTAVPEPQTWMMLGAGVLLAVGASRRQKPASR